MPNINFPYLSLALDAFGLVIIFIILTSCISERVRKRGGSVRFILLMSCIAATLIADIIGWIGEGHPEYAIMTLIANTVSTCLNYLTILCFMEYLRTNLYANSRAVTVITRIFGVLCILASAIVIGNLFYGYAYIVNETGHYVHSNNTTFSLIYMCYPLLAFFSVILMSLFAKRTAGLGRFAFVLYTLFPVAGVVIDYYVHGLSMAYIGLVVSVLIIYTNIYLQKQKIIDEQRNALMLSQINPHFMYNTLSTIAAMCESSPKQAKNLTLEFSQYLRTNLDTLTNTALIPFVQELKHVACYLKIEKARFREKLNVTYSVQCQDFLIPALSVQPIVENAIRHGITKKAEGGTVKISTYCSETSYVIEIKDDGVGFDADEAPSDGKTHVGLSNVQARISSMCRGEMTVKSIPGVGTRVVIEIPKGKQKGRKE